jgi:hypothetical protein
MRIPKDIREEMHIDGGHAPEVITYIYDGGQTQLSFGRVGLSGSIQSERKNTK